jgi:hypothetical protein
MEQDLGAQVSPAVNRGLGSAEPSGGLLGGETQRQADQYVGDVGRIGRPSLLDTLLLPDDAERPRRKYLDWHREKVFVR